MKITKVLLLISLTAWVIGLTTDVLWGFGLPVGAIFFGLFLNFKMLEKEVAKFDEEQRLRFEMAARFQEGEPTSKNPSTTLDHDLASAHARASA